MSSPLLVATRKGLFVFERRETGWKPARAVAFLGSPVTATLHDRRDGCLYAALNLGHFGVKLHRSRDLAQSWEECAAPAYPPRPESWTVDEAKPGSKAPWSTVQIWCLEAGGAGEDGLLWAGTLPGGLFVSRDRGASWELVRSLWDRPERLEWFGGGYDHAGIHSICVDPRTPRRLTVAISCGGVWRSDDGGASWRLLGRGLRAAYMPPEQQNAPNIQDVHRLAQCAAAPERFWAQHHNGIFRSSDGAESFEELAAAGPSTFGFAVAVHPREPDTAWFAPAQRDECRVPVEARVVVTRTRDGGRSFEVLEDGLPRPPAYDLVYRHGLAVDSSGACLALGSTTGGLWLSENGGDSWREIAGRLPPVYALRFGGA